MAKVKFGLKNVHIAVMSDSTSAPYATPIKFPGAKSLSLEAQGDINKFYADDIVYYQTVYGRNQNSGSAGNRRRKESPV